MAIRDRDSPRCIEPLYVSYARELRLGEALERAESKPIRRINRLVVYYFGAYLCNLDLEASRCNERPNGGSTRRHKCTPSPWKRQLRLGWIPRALLACFLACTAYLVLVLGHQYAHDFDLLRLAELSRRRRQWHAGDGMANSSQVLHRIGVLEAEIAARLEETRRVLDTLGSNYAHLTILAECFYLPIWAHYRYQRPFDLSHAVRDLLDGSRENAHIKRMVETQVAKYLQSSCVFYDENGINQDENLYEGPLWRRTGSGAVHLCPRLQLAANEQQLSRHSADTQQAVREMLAAGALKPLYKLPAWTRKRSLVQLGHHLWLFAYTVLFHISLTAAAFGQARASVPQTHSARYRLVEVASLGALAISAPTVILHSPLFTVNVSEQIHYIAELRRLIRRCIDANSELAPRACLAVGWDTRRHASRRATMNFNLHLVLLLHYKIFVAQLRPIRRSLGVVNLPAMVLLFGVPIVTRLHLPYLDKLEGVGPSASRQHRLFAIAISCSVLAPVNLMSLPLCHMFARCQRLYRDLASLMAHISEVRAQPNTGRVRLYDAHAENCLAKELADSGRLLDQLKVRAACVSGTYTVLVKGLFLYGLVAISIMVDTTSESPSLSGFMTGDGAPVHGESMSLGVLLSDPLGVYSQIKL